MSGEKLRERLLARGSRSVARTLEFAEGCPIEPVLRGVFARLAPGRVVPDTWVTLSDRMHNYGADEAYATTEGDGLVIAEHCGGAVFGEDISRHYHLLVGDEVVVYVGPVPDHYIHASKNLKFTVAATPEALDVATDALLQIAAKHGGKFLRRVDA